MMSSYSAAPSYRRLLVPLAWVGGFALSFTLLGQLILFSQLWLEYVFLGLGGVFLLLGCWIGGRWIYLHPKIGLSERGITLNWPWKQQFVHWREVLTINPNAQQSKGWLMGEAEGYRITYGREKTVFLSFRGYAAADNLHQWMRQVISQIPLADVANVSGLAVDKVGEHIAPEQPPFSGPRTYDGRIWPSWGILYPAFIWAIAIYALVVSQWQGEEQAGWFGLILFLFPVWMFYWNFHRFVLDTKSLRIVKRLWFSDDVILPLAEIEKIRFERRNREDRSMVVYGKDGRKRRFVAGQLREHTWGELVYDLVAVGVAVDYEFGNGRGISIR